MGGVINMSSLKFNKVYEVVSGSFKGEIGLLQAGIACGVVWLKTGLDSRILVSIDQIELVK